MRARENSDLIKINSMLSTLSENELKAVKYIVEYIAAKKESAETDPFLEFLLKVPEVEPTKEELEMIKKAKRTKKTFTHEQLKERYGL